MQDWDDMHELIIMGTLSLVEEAEVHIRRALPRGG